MFVLLARAMRTSSGPLETQLVLMTNEIKRVVETARDVEKLGYKFQQRPDRNEGTFAYRLTREHPYESDSLEFSDPLPPKGHPLVFKRVTSQSDESGWAEHWFDKNLKREFEGKPKEETATV